MEQIQKYLVPGSAPKKQLSCWMLGGQDWRSLDSMGDRLETIVKSIRL